MGGKFEMTQLVHYFSEQLEGTPPYVTVPDTLSLSVQMVLKSKIPDAFRKQL
jgi:hypothetical protein